MNSYASDESKAVEYIARAVMVTKPAKRILRKVKQKVDDLSISPWTFTAITLSYHYQRTQEITTKIVPEWYTKAGLFYIRPDVTYQPNQGSFNYLLSSTWSF